MKEKLDNPSLDNLQITHIKSTKQHATHSVAGRNHLELGLGQLFDNGLTANKSRLLSLDDANVVGFSILGLPGVGKTTLIEETFEALSGLAKIGVIEADTPLEIDTTRLQLLGIPVLPLKSMHKEHSYSSDYLNRGNIFASPSHNDKSTPDPVEEALLKLDLEHFDAILFEETATAFPSSAGWMHKKVAVLTIANGEDIPRKHPWILADADCVVITKVDLLPHLKADLGQLLDNIEELHPGVPIFDLSAQTGDGMEAWVQWVIQEIGGSIAEDADLMFADKPVYVPLIG